jgi:hypothetical protein
MADRARRPIRKGAKWQARSFDPGMEIAERRSLLRASEKPLSAPGPDGDAARGEPGSIDPRAGETQSSGSGKANRPALSIA